MTQQKARPEGFDFTKPDDIGLRCQRCNKNGMNRTGWIPVGYMGASTNSCWAVDCPERCFFGLVNLDPVI